jgi:hypothetical protein
VDLSSRFPSSRCLAPLPYIYMHMYGRMCSRSAIGVAEEALLEALSVQDVACRSKISPVGMIGSGNSWVHCVRLQPEEEGTDGDEPVLLCNDTSLGWQGGLQVHCHWARVVCLVHSQRLTICACPLYCSRGCGSQIPHWTSSRPGMRTPSLLS